VGVGVDRIRDGVEHRGRDGHVRRVQVGDRLADGFELRRLGFRRGAGVGLEDLLDLLVNQRFGFDDVLAADRGVDGGDDRIGRTEQGAGRASRRSDSR
jgi:hypothetical protein